MRILRSAREFADARKELVGSVGFVPTMGALHEGHRSLLEKAKEQNDHVAVSIFVNPTQFLAHEDLSRYPRREEADIKICELCDVDLLFLPSPDEIYAPDEPKVAAPNILGYTLEGRIRPGHFDGVLTVVLKLLNLANATKAYFGQKDAQQLLLITQMAERFFLPTEIVGCPTLRDRDGLAMSSRNAYLNPQEREMALSISDSLFRAASLIGSGERDVQRLKEQMVPILSKLNVDYVEFTDRKLQNIETVTASDTIIHIAARVGTTRLIDNLWV